MNKKSRLFSLLAALSLFLTSAPVSANVRTAMPAVGSLSLPIIGGHGRHAASVGPSAASLSVPTLQAATIAPAPAAPTTPAARVPTLAQPTMESAKGLSEQLQSAKTPQGLDLAAGRHALERFWSGAPVLDAADASSEELPVKEWDQPMSLTKDLPNMVKSVSEARNAKPRVEVAQVAGMPGAFLAMFPNIPMMNMALDRASLFIETGVMYAHDKLTSARGGQYAAGHDLRGRDLLRFWDAFQKAKPSMTTTPRDRAQIAVEEGWWKWLLPTLRKLPDMVLLGVSVGREMQGVIAHEILHLQFFTDPRIRPVVERFWDEKVSAADKAAIKQQLAPNYNVEDRELLVNEFQAYMLQDSAQYYELGLFLNYREPLRAALAAVGVTPVQFNLAPGA
jgi:hypothetical protein